MAITTSKNLDFTKTVINNQQQNITTREFPIIKTERLLLRQIVENDLENVFKGLSHPDIIKYYGVNYQSLEATKEQMTFLQTLKKTKREFGGLFAH